MEINIPGDNQTPVSITDELVLSNRDSSVEELEIYFGADVYVTWAEDSTSASSRLGGAATRRKMIKGMIKMYQVRDDNLKLFVRLVDGSGLTGGIDKEVYHFTSEC